VVVPTHGDCLAVERKLDAKKARAADLSNTDRLEGLEPVPQEFHHRGLMLQVSIQYTEASCHQVMDIVMISELCVVHVAHCIYYFCKAIWPNT